MLYSSSRNSLIKTLGSTHFKDNIFATSKGDLTPEAYEAHKRHQSAPKPMSAREKEAEATRQAEKEASLVAGSRTPVSHIGQGLPSQWTSEVEEAVKALNESEGGSLVLLVSTALCVVLVFSFVMYFFLQSIDSTTENLKIASSTQTTYEGVGSAIPTTDPCMPYVSLDHITCLIISPPKHSLSSSYRLPRPQVNILTFHLSHYQSDPSIVFIYSCPSTCPVKNRMIYSSSALGTLRKGRELLPTLAKRKIETSDPSELTEAFFKSELGDVSGQSSGAPTPPPTTGFARPRGPARRAGA
jgi:twinfilin